MTVATQGPRLHPMLWAAGLSVTAFSLVGIAAVTGVLPQQDAAPATEPAPVVQAAEPAATPVPSQAPTVAPVAPAAAKPAVQRRTAPRSEGALQKVAHRNRDEPYIAAHQDAGIDVYEVPREVPRQAAAEPRPAPVCDDCGVVASVQAIQQAGEANGIGAVAGGVVGGLLGRNIGKGRGRDLATIAAIAGGAYAGHQIEKSQRTTTVYNVTVRMADGSSRLVTDRSGAWQVGDPVRVRDDGTLAVR